MVRFCTVSNRHFIEQPGAFPGSTLCYECDGGGRGGRDDDSDAGGRAGRVCAGSQFWDRCWSWRWSYFATGGLAAYCALVAVLGERRRNKAISLESHAASADYSYRHEGT